MKIGILGGTFDPIHNGHINIAKKAILAADLDFVIMLPSGIPYFKTRLGKVITNSSLRLKMLEKAIENEDKLILSDIEIKKDKPTYTIETILELKNMYVGAEFYFIIGSDILYEIEQWHDSKRLLQEISIILFSRDTNTDKHAVQIELLHVKYGIKILAVNTDILEVSSSQIRESINDTQLIDKLLPDGVYNIIKEYKLYLV